MKLGTLQKNLKLHSTLGTEKDTKFVGIRFCPHCKKEGIKIIDCNNDIGFIHHGFFNDETGDFEIDEYCSND